MRRANVQRQSDRRLEILDAAQRCFARSGFHGASMQEICAEAGDEPGQSLSLFPLQGGADRRHLRAQPRRGRRQLRWRSTRRPASSTGSAALARHHLVERPEEEAGLCAEIMAESRRNPEIARLHTELEQDIKKRLVDMLRRAAARGEISDDGRSRRRRHHADGARRRPVVARALRSLVPGRSRAAARHEHGAVPAHAPACRLAVPRCGSRLRSKNKEADNESQPHHRARPGRRRHAVDRVRASAAARDRGKQRRHPHQRGRRRRSCSASASRRPAWCRTAASSCSPAAPRPTAGSPSRRAPAAS